MRRQTLKIVEKKYAQLTKCAVKMVVYWTSSLSFCYILMDRDEVEVLKNAVKDRG